VDYFTEEISHVSPVLSVCYYHVNGSVRPSSVQFLPSMGYLKAANLSWPFTN